jgi:excisionase family DNA binding protein
LYTVNEVAKILKVKPNAVLNYIKAGKLKALKVGGTSKAHHWRITAEALAEFTGVNTKCIYLQTKLVGDETMDYCTLIEKGIHESYCQQCKDKVIDP